MELFYLGILCLAIGLYFGWIQWRLHHKIGTGSVTAKLINWKYQQNAKVRSGGYTTKTYRHYTTYEYAYSLNNKEYKIKGQADKVPGDLPKQVNVVYLLNAPHHKHIPGKTVDISLFPAILGIIWGGFILILWLILQFF